MGGDLVHPVDRVISYEVFSSNLSTKTYNFHSIFTFHSSKGILGAHFRHSYPPWAPWSDQYDMEPTDALLDRPLGREANSYWDPWVMGSRH